MLPMGTVKRNSILECSGISGISAPLTIAATPRLLKKSPNILTRSLLTVTLIADPLVATQPTPQIKPLKMSKIGRSRVYAQLRAVVILFLDRAFRDAGTNFGQRW